ncbi:hypothetical protein BDY24DRAFT_438126 [Mrakia frigida]|uniref:uncharacterized protein n=1 Tax=Mrakia frigida TaxID=29902 RepID=UPI003FCC2476
MNTSLTQNAVNPLESPINLIQRAWDELSMERNNYRERFLRILELSRPRLPSTTNPTLLHLLLTLRARPLGLLSLTSLALSFPPLSLGLSLLLKCLSPSRHRDHLRILAFYKLGVAQAEVQVSTK